MNYAQYLAVHRLYLAAALVAFVASLVLTPYARRLALWLDIVDHPDGHRKLHLRATPLGGGLAVLLSFLVAVAVISVLSPSQRHVFVSDSGFVYGLILSSVAICIVGLLDDRFHLRGRQKLLGQIAAASILMVAGLCIREVQIFHWSISLGLLAYPFTLFWLLGAINSLNLIDGVDGLAASVGIVLSLAIAAIAHLTGHRTETFLALSMSGALTGLLIYNRSPASIFLGDAGSMLIGLVLGALAIRGSFKGAATAALAAPTAILAIPIFDVLMAIVRRRLTGRSIYTSDRAHLHHTLLKRGFSKTGTVGVIGLLCSVTAVGAVLSVAIHNEMLAVAAVIGVVITLVLSRWYGHQESLLVGQQLLQFVKTLLPRVNLQDPRSRQLHTHLDGNRRWEELWATLTAFADRFDLSAVQLNIMIPSIGEEYHASWRRKQMSHDHVLWHSDIPLVVGKVSIGRLKVSGSCGDKGVCVWMGELIAGLQPFETHMLDLLGEGFELPASREPVPSANDGYTLATNVQAGKVNSINSSR